MKEVIIKSREEADWQEVLDAWLCEWSAVEKDGTRYIFQREPECPGRLLPGDFECFDSVKKAVSEDRANEQKRIAWAIRAATERDDWTLLEKDYPEIAKVVRAGLTDHGWLQVGDLKEAPCDCAVAWIDDDGIMWSATNRAGTRFYDSDMIYIPLPSDTEGE